MKNFFFTFIVLSLLIPTFAHSDTLRISSIDRRLLSDSIPGVICKHYFEALPNEVRSHFKSASVEKMEWYGFWVLNNSALTDTLYFERQWYYDVFCFAFSKDERLIYTDTIGDWSHPAPNLYPDQPFLSYIPVPQGAVKVYIGSRVPEKYEGKFDFNLFNKSSLFDHLYEKKKRTGIQMLINTLSLGFLAFVFLFFLFYTLSVRQKLYAMYSLYLFMALIFCLTMWNELPYHAQVYFFQLTPIRYILNETAVAWMFVAYIFFGNQLLGISDQIKWFGYLLYAEAGVLFLYGLWHLLFKLTGWMPDLVNDSYLYFRLFFMPNYLFILLFILFRIRSKLKPFFMIANVFLLAGVVSSVVVDFTVGVWVIYGVELRPSALLQSGIVGETILFSLALGYNNVLIFRQRAENRKKYIEQLHENNRLIENEKHVLEQKVREARREILEQQKQIEDRKLKQLHIDFENRINELTIQSLEAQMNPHFLFNGLSAVRDLVLKNRNEEAMEYINTFALLLRTSLNNNRKQSILLQEELESTGHYLQIEKLRFGEDFSFFIETDPLVDPMNIEVPPKLLQPIAENAVKHGLRHSRKKQKRIWIKVQRVLGGVKIEVEDNGIGMEASSILNKQNISESAHLGLKLMEERLAVFNQQNDNTIAMTIEEVKNRNGDVEGTSVAILIANAEDKNTE